MSQEKKIRYIKIIMADRNAKFVAAQNGICYQTFKNWLAGRHMPENPEILDKIAEYLENSCAILRQQAETTEDTRNACEGKNGG